MQNTHEPGENDKFDPGSAQHLYELLFYFRLQSRAKPAWRQIGVRNPKLPRQIKDRCIQHVRNHETRFRSKITGADAPKDRPAVASFSRPENSNWKAFHLNRLVSPLLLVQICSINPEVEYPISNGMRRIAAPISFNIARSS